jgi:hypothetical protein
LAVPVAEEAGPAAVGPTTELAPIGIAGLGAGTTLEPVADGGIAVPAPVIGTAILALWDAEAPAVVDAAADGALNEPELGTGADPEAGAVRFCAASDGAAVPACGVIDAADVLGFVGAVVGAELWAIAGLEPTEDDVDPRDAAPEFDVEAAVAAEPWAIAGPEPAEDAVDPKGEEPEFELETPPADEAIRP